MKSKFFPFSLLKIPFDFLIVFGSFFLAREIRELGDQIPGIELPMQTIVSMDLFGFAIFGALLYIVVFASHSMYSLEITHSKIKEVLDILRFALYWMMFFSIGVYFGNGIIYDSSEIPRLIIVFTCVFTIVGSIITRIFLNVLQRRLVTIGTIDKKRVVIITNDGIQTLKPILDDIKKADIYNVVGFVNSRRIYNKHIPYIGSIEELQTLCEKRSIDEIIYVSSNFNQEDLTIIWDMTRVYGLRYRYITNSFDITQTNTRLSLIHNIPVIEIQNTPLQYWSRVWKRLFDITGSILGILLFIPMYILFGILIKLEDPSGPIIYKNKRIGQNGKVFHCLKFRYLKWEYCVKESYGIENKDDPAIDHENRLIAKQSKRSGPLYKISQDPRMTKVGRLLEKYSIDEIPQFINVFFGDMSIVGPRPHQPREVEKYNWKEQRLLTIKPGITGMAQANGREKNNFEKEVMLDIFYIENWSFLLDLKIIVKTIGILISRK